MRAGPLLIKLAVASLVVGFLIRQLGYTPLEVVEHFFQRIADLLDWSWRHAKEIGIYVLTGAVIVVPVWGFFALLRYLRTRGPKS